MSPATRIHAATATHQGRVRRRNEDHHALSTVDVSRTDGEVTSTTAQAGPFLAVVADGLGGHPTGDVASRVAVETIAARFPVDGDELCEAVHRSNDRVVQAMREPGGKPAMGTTISAVVVHGNRFTVVNVGDSPVFELVDDDLEQLSVDDSDHSGYLTQTIGGSLGIVPVAPHVADHVIDARRRIMLSSDGLTNFVTAPQIVDALTETDPARAVERLISLTLEAGAPDNVTVVVLDLEPLTSAQLPSTGKHRLTFIRKPCTAVPGCPNPGTRVELDGVETCDEHRYPGPGAQLASSRLKYDTRISCGLCDKPEIVLEEGGWRCADHATDPSAARLLIPGSGESDDSQEETHP